MPVDRAESVGSKVHHATSHNVAQNAKKKLNKLYRSRSNTDSSIQALPREYDADVGTLPDAIRNRLYELFGAIEKEFEALYSENYNLHAKVEALSAKLGEGGISLDKTVDFLDFDMTNTKVAKKSSQVGQKIKTAFRVPPGRLVSSFKAGVGVGNDASRVSYVRSLVGHRDGVWDVDTAALSSLFLIGSASADQTACIWNESGCILGQYVGHSGSVNSIRFSPVNRNMSDLLVLTASGDHSAHIWRPNITSAAAVTVSSQPLPGSSDDELDPTSEKEDGTGECGVQHSVIKSPAIELTGHSGVVICADWLAGGAQVISASWDRTAKIYDAERGEILHVLSGHDQELTHTCAHSSQRLVVTASKDTTFRLWDFREPIHSVSVFQGHTDSVTSAVFSVADKVVSGSDDRTVKVWDLRNMRSALATIRLDSPVNRLSVSAAHNVIAIPHDNRHVRLYDLQGNRIARLPSSNRRGHRRMVCSTAWSTDNVGTFRPELPNLVTCGFDKTIITWKVNFNIAKD